MLVLTGKYNNAHIFTDEIDSSTIGQIVGMCNLEAYKNSQIRIMPDCHCGIGCVIGTTITLKDAVTPNLVGIDIGCGMLAVKLKEKRINLPEFDSIVKKYIENKEHKPNYSNDTLLNLKCYNSKAPLRKELANDSLGTLGGGNHFIELDKDSNGDIWLVIHTGSRHLGIEVCNWYQKLAYEERKFEANNGNYDTKSKEFIAQLKSKGNKSNINKELEKFRKSYTEVEPSVPYTMAHCTGSLMSDYIHDMEIVQDHAALNRSKIAEIILKKAKLHEVDRFDTVHNYIDTNRMILRKGAVSAEAGERLLIPINMRDGSLICIGRGNPDWNYSAPHGAGRLYSRSETKQRFSVSEYKETMKEHGIYTTSVGASTLDECPMAYKSMQSILDNITDTVDVVDIIKPIYNYKAGKDE